MEYAASRNSHNSTRIIVNGEDSKFEDIVNGNITISVQPHDPVE